MQLLTIELVPSTSWFNNVRSVVSRKQWDAIKAMVFGKAWDTCEICSGVGPKYPVECHEIWHYDDKKLIQKLIGMIALCPDCHMVKHMGLAIIQNKGNKALKHFMKINSLTKKVAEKSIEKAFILWEKRSKKKYKLDISHLQEYGIDIKKIKKHI